MLMLQANQLHTQLDNKPAVETTCETSDTCVSRCAAYGKVCPSNARAAGAAARKKMAAILSNSELFDGEPQFRKVALSDILMGDRLGEGGFSMVNACSFKEAPLDEALAIKRLKRRIMVERKCFEYGASDLATEAYFLARFDHPNIVKLHAVTEGNVEANVSSGKEGGFFIVIDRLVETLEHRIERWRTQAEETPHSIFYRMSRDYKEKQRSMLKERVEIALQIAQVMEYLHSMNVLFRDLKPDNIGFDTSGTLKMFDFGLAKEEKVSEVLETGLYKMTGHTGSRRYMAPEVAMGKPYNKSVDVFSFGIILWEICSLEKPYAGYSSNRHMKDVVIGGERPKMDSAHTAHWPVDLQWLMKSSWSAEYETRPSFAAITATLQAVLQELGTPLSEWVRATSEGSALHSPPSTKRWKMSRIISRS